MLLSLALLIYSRRIFNRDLGLGVASYDPIADCHKGGKALAVERVVVLLALGKNPHGLACSAVFDADLGSHLLDVVGYGVEREGM